MWVVLFITSAVAYGTVIAFKQRTRILDTDHQIPQGTR